MGIDHGLNPPRARLNRRSALHGFAARRGLQTGRPQRLPLRAGSGTAGRSCGCARAIESSPATASRPMSSQPRSPASWPALFGPSPGACPRRRADRKKPVIASQGSAGESSDMLLPDKAGGNDSLRTDRSVEQTIATGRTKFLTRSVGSPKTRRSRVSPDCGRSLGGEAFGGERLVRRRFHGIRRRRSFFLDLGEQPGLNRGGPFGTQPRGVELAADILPTKVRDTPT
jgi:hypothetical protein